MTQELFFLESLHMIWDACGLNELAGLLGQAVKQNSDKLGVIAYCQKDRGDFLELCVLKVTEELQHQSSSVKVVHSAEEIGHFAPWEAGYPHSLPASSNQVGAGRSASGLVAMEDWDVSLSSAALPGVYTGGTGISSESRGEIFVSTDFWEHLFCFICSDSAF